MLEILTERPELKSHSLVLCHSLHFYFWWQLYIHLFSI